MAKKPQAPHSLDELVALVRERFAQLSPQFQIAVRYLIDHPEQVPVESMRRVAANAGVQPATMVRLAQSLHYDGWESLRQVFVRSLHQHPRRYTDQARDLLQKRSSRAQLSRHIAVQTSNLRLLEELNEGALNEAARLLTRSKHVHIAGFRASYAAAYSLHYLYGLFRNSVSLIRGEAGLLELEMRAMEADDAVVIVGFAPYSQEAMRVAEAARRRGCRSVVICDSKVAPIALNAEVVLEFPTETSGFFPSVAPAIVLVEALANRLLGRSGQQALSALGFAEDQLHSEGAYLDMSGSSTTDP
jgi:Transcriptional regulators